MLSVTERVFKVLALVLQKYNYNPRSGTVENFLFLFLFKLKWNISFTCLAELFVIPRSTLQTNFNLILEILFIGTKSWIYWPSRQEINANMPPCFSGELAKTRLIIDCTEIETSSPQNLQEQALLYSSYKHSHTVKFLIGKSSLIRDSESARNILAILGCFLLINYVSL